MSRLGQSFPQADGADGHSADAASLSLAVSLLLACARTSLDDAATESMRALVQPGVDWPRVIELAKQHDITPLLHLSLAAACPDLVPADSLTALKSWQRANALRSLSLTRELLRLLRALETRAIPVLPYKGPLLAEMAYGDMALRHCADLDILVRPQDVAAARQVCAELGYTLTAECAQHQAAYAHVHHHYALSHSGSQTFVELHWRLVTRQFSFGLTFDGLWQRRISFPLAGQPVRGPSVEDTLLIICVHSAMHGWKELKQVCDVAELVQRQAQMDWQAVLQRARSLGVQRMLFLSLRLANSVLGVPLPAPVAEQVHSDSAVEPLASAIGQVMLGAQRSPAESGMRSFFHYYAPLRERQRDRIAEGLRRIFVPNMEEWAALPLPEPLSFLHYVIRPLRLARRCWRALRRKRS